MVSEGRVYDVPAKMEKGRPALEAFVPYSRVPASLAQMPIRKAAGQSPKKLLLNSVFLISNFYPFLFSKIMFLPGRWLGFPF